MLSHFSCNQLIANLSTIACQTPLSMGFSRQEYWNGLPCASLGDISDPGMELVSLESPTLAGGFFTISAALSLDPNNLQGKRRITGDSESLSQGRI